MKDLPRVFVSPIEKDLTNNEELFYGNVRGDKQANPLSIIKKVNNIFSSPNHVYKSKVKLTLKDKVVEEVIVGKTNTSLLTIKGELIKITNILDIERLDN